MEKTYLFATQGVCAGAIEIKVAEEVITSARFVGGCNGNTSGIGILVTGEKVDDIIAKLKDVRCGRRPTSCP
ncbi:MAG: TIGR03905 family TSCPD domain-containing protein, partial [Oscillospiraceae bacterium]|nr:TIGR03905 family TSCPD domain-containing protein [Oscillospiraceae bacterium]